MARKTISDIAALLNITLEGNLIAPAMLAKVERLEADAQREEDYAVKPGLTIRDEIPRAFRIGQALFSHFSNSDAVTAGATLRFVMQLLTDVFGFTDLQTGGRRQSDGRDYLVHLEAGDGRVPVIVVPPQDSIDRASEALAFDDRKRSASTALQDWLNAEDEALWGLATNGDVIRLMRDNASLTRPAFVEADLKQIFETEDYSSFSALWLLLHRSRFGDKPAPVTDCALERWRDTGSKEGAVVRDRLRDGVEDALRVLGSGFLEANPDLRKRLSEGDLKLTVFFNELLRIIYRLIFLMVAEDRDLLHDPDASPAMRQLYADGYSLKRLRERSIRRSNWDKHRDLYEGLKIVFRSLATGQSKLGLPALGGLFDQGLMPDLDKASLPNRALMEAVYRLAWLKEKDALLPINWREMETEELGSVYESLLELTPRIDIAAKRFYFAEGEETKGNQRKTTGSYYTPDSLVQVLLDSALDPVLDRIEREADDPADALTKATVIDPACGSGHFLLAAARRIATRVARIRAGGVASATDFRHALRDVARGCIHGVDRNPMAVELTKVALWIETVEPGKPLGFLDANIRCGDALLGVFDLSVLREGIPDAAYKPLTGDDKDIAKYYREKNKRERKERSKVESGFGFERQREVTKDYARVREMPEDSVKQVEAKTAALQGLMASGSSAWELQQACDLYIASFMLPKIKGGEHVCLDGLPQRGRETIPTSGTIWEYLRGVTQFGPLMGASIDSACSVRAFHWPLQFPDIIARGGFDVVLGNPPWERVKVQEKEYFASRNLEIANAKNAAARKRLIGKLSETDPNLAQEWKSALRAAATESQFMRESGRYPFGGVGDVNTYAVFADLAHQVLHSLGRAGLIVPNGLVVGFTYRAFLAKLLSNKSLVSFYGFENEDLLFKDVHHEMKFGLLTISGSGLQTAQPWFTAHIRQPAEIGDPKKRYALTVEEIEAINPNTLNLPAFRWSRNAQVMANIHTAAPILVEKQGNEITQNNWQVEFLRMFDMANDSHHFIGHIDVADKIIDREESLAILNDGRRIFPLYEGKMFWHFDHRYGTYLNQSKAQANQGVVPRISLQEQQTKEFRTDPRYWVSSDLVTDTLGDKSNRKWFIGWRDVGPSERTLIATALPNCALGDTAYAMFPNRLPKENIALLAIVSSFLVDYAARQKSKRMKFFVIEQLPIITPEQIENRLDFVPAKGRVDWLANRVLELCYTNEELRCLAEEMELDVEPFIWDDQRRDQIIAELNAAVFHLYNVSRDSVSWLMDSFDVHQRYQERDYGIYRTKELILTAFDAMTKAKELGREYQTPLTIPPADPSLCHGPDQLQVSHKTDSMQPPSTNQLPNAAWARTTPSPQTDPAIVLAAILKAVDGPTPIRAIRMTALMTLEPHLFTPFLPGSDRADWQRLVGQEANPQVGNIARLPTLTSPGWNTAITNHRGNGRLIEDLAAGTWAPGTGLDAFYTVGWPDGRAGFALRAIHELGFDTVLSSAPKLVQEFINAA